MAPNCEADHDQVWALHVIDLLLSRHFAEAQPYASGGSGTEMGAVRKNQVSIKGMRHIEDEVAKPQRVANTWEGTARSILCLSFCLLPFEM
jgi:hypothetical protein